MTFATRMIVILSLLLPFGCVLAAQETTTAATSTAATTTATSTTATTKAEAAEAAPEGTSPNAYETRSEFTQLLRNSPPELARIFALDPALLADPAFVARYPEIAQFVAAHPEIPRHANFYVGQFLPEPVRESDGDRIIEPLMVVSGIAIVVFALSWLVRTWIEQRRWTRVSRVQTEVHNKILDRFGSTPELLEYIKSPAGTKFLESAPIAVRAETPAAAAPMARVMWSVQVGVVVAAAALGMLLVGLRMEKDSGDGLFALGMIALSVGVGFIGSAAVSLFLSRRLGLWQPPQPADEPGLVK